MLCCYLLCASLAFDISKEADETKYAFLHYHFTYRLKINRLHPCFTHLSGSFCSLYLYPLKADNLPVQLLMWAKTPCLILKRLVTNPVNAPPGPFPPKTE